MNATVCLSLGIFKLTIGVVAPRFLGEVLSPEFSLHCLRFEGRTGQTLRHDLFRFSQRRLFTSMDPWTRCRIFPP